MLEPLINWNRYEPPVEGDRTVTICIGTPSRDEPVQPADDAVIRADGQDVSVEQGMMRCAEKQAIARIYVERMRDARRA
jgi:hypothetical protein